MLYATTPTGMRTLARDYRESDIRRATIRRATTAAHAAPAAASEQHVAPRRLARLITILPHAR
jgi:hypothetical protein